jgi:hypothetical protein
MVTPLSELADAELAQLIATAALLPIEKCAAFVQRVAAALVAGEAYVQGAIAAAQWDHLSAPAGGLLTGRGRPGWVQSSAWICDFPSAELLGKLQQPDFRAGLLFGHPQKLQTQGLEAFRSAGADAGEV